MALTEYQKSRLIDMLDRNTVEENDAILRSVDNFTHFLYFSCRDIFDAIHSVLRGAWNWIKSIFR